MARLELLRTWKSTVDTYTLTLTGAVPEAMADFHPVPEQMTVLELIDHLASDEHGAQRDLLRVLPEAADQPKLNPGKSVQESRRVLKEIFLFTDTILRTRSERDLDRSVEIPVLDVTVTVAQIVQSMIEHLIHHRGQLLTYLRMKGIAPTPRWQE